jgi:hypothetical protein
MIEGAAIATQDVLQTVDPADVTAGGIGFVVIASLAVGTAILLRSMNKQLKKVDFEEEPETDGAEAARSETARAETDRAEDKPLSNGSLGDGSEEGPKSSAP